MNTVSIYCLLGNKKENISLILGYYIDNSQFKMYAVFFSESFLMLPVPIPNVFQDTFNNFPQSYWYLDSSEPFIKFW